MGGWIVGAAVLYVAAVVLWRAARPVSSEQLADRARSYQLEVGRAVASSCPGTLALSTKTESGCW